MLLTNYKHTQPTLGLSVTFVFNIEYIYRHTYIHTYIYKHTPKQETLSLFISTVMYQVGILVLY